MAAKITRPEFESKYGSPSSPDKNVLIGMKGGKAVYGSELDATDTKGANVINNTYSQNQAIMKDMFSQMSKSGGTYNPSPQATAKMDQMYPPTKADSTVTARADGKQMVGPTSPEAASMREPSSNDAQFLKTLAGVNARPNRTSAVESPEAQPPPDLRKIAEESKASEASPFTKGPAPFPAMTNVLGGPAPTTEPPAFDVAGDNLNYLLGLRSEGATPSAAIPLGGYGGPYNLLSEDEKQKAQERSRNLMNVLTANK